ncbi:hypothetical protein [Haloarcula nitratireducens]|uniref:Uncharacterized protein n=1 Tax=Haloarcula nitratireducens TaxID=2487749 RepID=A0AAW4PE13_9EURY|nr:hypothetical protein [Halomicroarcula nitratireducens]MBX0296222.1 hypothetical protein [Halomicroarcula nitratireducens]
MNSAVDPDEETDIEFETELDPDADADIGTANTMRQRADESRIKIWIMLAANRLVVTGLLALIVFVTVTLVGAEFYPAFHADLQQEDTIETIFSTMIGAIITGTTLVVTISQLVISQENGPLGDQHERMSSTMNVRDYTRELVDRPVPADPSAFLRHIVNASETRARKLREAVAGKDDEELKAEVNEFTTSIIGNAKQVRKQLDGANFGSFGVLFAALNYNYGWKIFHVERIEYEYEESLTDDDRSLLEDLRSTLAMFGPGREHIKTLYFEWALINLSQLILYISVPALIIAGAMLAFIGESSFPGSTFGFAHMTLVVTAAFTITLLPHLLLVSYIARVATVAKRTLAIGPLILRDSQR